jgi:HIRAN domain
LSIPDLRTKIAFDVSLIRRLLRGPAPAPAAGSVEVTLYDGGETLEVVGESHYQEALWEIVGGRRREHVRHETYVLLVPDPDNRYDANAIEVRINGLLVGYLSREDAALYRPGLLKLMEKSANNLVALHAVIVGGGERSDGLGRLGVFIDHDPADFGLAPHHVPSGQIRTGLSQALASDLDDDRYDLSWYATLSTDDLTAAEQLRTHLAAATDPIDRHYAFCELEQRLYHARTVSASALDEFDTACRDHDAEMEVIRPALVEKFGSIPMIEMYRQEVIRCQKAKLWQAAREWAERGIAVYGVDAGRPEVVDDLHKRLAHAMAKLETVGRPPRTRRQVVAAVNDSVNGRLETLVCSSCGATFERTRMRGRKPRLCPACRGLTSVSANA